MSNLGRRWAGKLYGTNTGNLYLTLESNNQYFSGILRISDDRFGLSIFDVTGNFDGAKIHISGDSNKSPENVQNGKINAEGYLNAAGELRGDWVSTIGTSGTFILLPHDGSEIKQIDPTLPPERLHYSNRILGAIRLYTDDLKNLIGFMARDFGQGRVTVTYRESGKDTTRYANDFQDDLNRFGEIRYIKLFIQAPEAYNLNRYASVELSADGVNAISVQGVQETWVIGQAEALISYLKSKENTLSTNINKYGLNVNFILMAGIVCALPELEFWKRGALISVGVILTISISYLHKKFIPNFTMYASPSRPSTLRRMGPQIASWIIAATSGIVAAIAYGLLKGEISISALKLY